MKPGKTESQASHIVSLVLARKGPILVYGNGTRLFLRVCELLQWQRLDVTVNKVRNGLTLRSNGVTVKFRVSDYADKPPLKPRFFDEASNWPDLGEENK